MAQREKAEVFDCTECTRPETHCEGCPRWEQPRLLELGGYYMKLYSRVMVFDALPRAGGLEDQNELTMRILDKIHRLVTPKRSDASEQG